MLVNITIAVGFLCLGAIVASVIWFCYYRRYVKWTIERIRRRDESYEKLDKHYDKLLQSARNMTNIARNAIEINDCYREYLRNKIVLVDPFTAQRRSNGQA